MSQVDIQRASAFSSGSKQEALHKQFSEAIPWWRDFLSRQSALSSPQFVTQWGSLKFPSHVPTKEDTWSKLIALDAKKPGIEHKPPFFAVDYSLFHANHVPHKGHRFDPEKDLNEGDVVLLLLEKDGSTFGRGWEIAEVVDIEPDGVDEIGVVYLQPAGNFREGPWNGEWQKKVLGHVLTESGQPWYDSVKRSQVCWASRLLSNNTIPSRERATVCGQIRRISLCHRQKDLGIEEAAKIYREEGLPLYPLYDIEEEEVQ